MNCSRNKFFYLGALLLLVAGNVRAETVFWSDGFETNVPSRWTTNSTWRIGSPTAGPATNAAGFRTHSGTNCASTQNYAYNDSRLVCTNYNGATSLIVPAASQYPRLRFWHWFNFANAYGFVEISTNNGGSWNQISPTYPNANTTTSGGVWSRPSIDLSAFAGQSVQIAFHFTGLCCGNGLGWYVDDVAVVTGAPVFNDPESFESGEGDWAVEMGTWEVGKPASGPNAAHTGTNCAATILAGNYVNNVDSRLISPPFAVPSNSPALHFWHWYNFNNAVGFVEISTNGGNTWNQISPAYQNGNTGGSWTNVSLDLSAYAGQTVQAAFHFGSLSSGTAPGWYVDDISLVEPPVLTVPGTQTIYAGQTLVVTNYAVLLPTNGTPAFALVSGPTGVNMDTNTGVLIWATTMSQPAGSYTNVIMVTDNNSPPLSTTNSFVVVVTNPWVPVLTVPPTQTIYAGQTLVITNYATNNFFQNDTFTFGLLPPYLPGVSLDANTGVLTWETTTAQPAGTYTNVIAVVDNVLQLSATNSFVIVVSNPPPPVLTVPPTQAIYAGETLVVTNYATNSVFPNCTFTFGTVSAPAGVSINPASGVLTWTPTEAQAPSYDSISVQVTDNNTPPLSAIASFSVLVSPTPPPVLLVPPTQIIYAGQTLVVTNYANSVLPNTTFTFGIVSAPKNVFINSTNGVLTWTNAAPSVVPATNTIFIFATDNSTLLGATNNFTVIILPDPPVLRISNTNGFQLSFDTFSNTTWLIEASTNLSSWQPLLTNTAGSDGTIQFTDLLATNYPWRFYRAVFP
jgi:hypothetical protein